MKHYKMRQISLQNATESYYKIGQVYYKLRYYKMRQLFQNVTFITNSDSTTQHRVNTERQLLQNVAFITNCDSTTQHRVNTEELYLLTRETNTMDTVQGCRERGLLKFKRTFKKKHTSVSEITISYLHKTIIIPLLCQSGLYINTCVFKNSIASKYLTFYFDITRYAEAAIYAKNLLFFSFYNFLVKFSE